MNAQNWFKNAVPQRVAATMVAAYLVLWAIIAASLLINQYSKATQLCSQEIVQGNSLPFG